MYTPNERSKKKNILRTDGYLLLHNNICLSGAHSWLSICVYSFNFVMHFFYTSCVWFSVFCSNSLVIVFFCFSHFVKRCVIYLLSVLRIDCVDFSGDGWCICFTCICLLHKDSEKLTLLAFNDKCTPYYM